MNATLATAPRSVHPYRDTITKCHNSIRSTCLRHFLHCAIAAVYRSSTYYTPAGPATATFCSKKKAQKETREHLGTVYSRPRDTQPRQNFEISRRSFAPRSSRRRRHHHRAVQWHVWRRKGRGKVVKPPHSCHPPPLTNCATSPRRSTVTDQVGHPPHLRDHAGWCGGSVSCPSRVAPPAVSAPGRSGPLRHATRPKPLEKLEEIKQTPPRRRRPACAFSSASNGKKTSKHTYASQCRGAVHGRCDSADEPKGRGLDGMISRRRAWDSGAPSCRRPCPWLWRKIDGAGWGMAPPITHGIRCHPHTNTAAIDRRAIMKERQVVAGHGPVQKHSQTTSCTRVGLAAGQLLLPRTTSSAALSRYT